MSFSMTGYGRSEQVLHGRTITVELRSVNNRYLDTTIKIPRAYLFSEDAIKNGVQSSISRGKVDVFVTIVSPSGDGVEVVINETLANSYLEAIMKLSTHCHLPGTVSLDMVARFPDVLSVEKVKEDTDEVASDILQVLDVAILDFNAMRKREGVRLKEDMLSRGDTIEALANTIAKRNPETVSEYRKRLESKMQEVLQSTQIDESRILMEAAIFSDKVAVDEELVRLKSHLEQLRLLLNQDGPVGRKLDFLIQEFNREANTIGSKCNDVEISKHVIEMKSEIEKIREQVQNLE